MIPYWRFFALETAAGRRVNRPARRQPIRTELPGALNPAADHWFPACMHEGGVGRPGKTGGGGWVGTLEDHLGLFPR